MRARPFACLLLLPFALVLYCGEWLAEHEGKALALGLGWVSQAASESELSRRLRDGDEVALWRAQLAGMLDEVAEEEELVAASSRPVRRSRPARRGVFVSASKVLELARQGARPSGIAVARSGTRPAGLLLVGVSGLGVGLKDGDILTQALGRPAVSESTVVGAVIQARGARQPQLSGQIWRDGRTFPLIVVQPYLEAS